MDSSAKKIGELQAQLKLETDKLSIEKLKSEAGAMQEQMQSPNFWNDSQNAQIVSKQFAGIENRIKPWQEMSDKLSEADELLKLNDQAMLEEINSSVEAIEQELGRLKKDLAFSGPFDDHNAIISIHAGAGGTDAQNWAQMLLRMYVRWAEKNDFKTAIIDQSVGDEAGLKSATLEIDGSFVYGKLSHEHGVHRLVRLSPFNSDNLRQTSFAKVEVLPKIDQSSEADIPEQDLKVETYRAGGHGGQSVNTTDSAVRITHIPSGLSVAIQNERSQLQNKETAMTILRSRLTQLQIEQHKEKLEDIKGPNQSAEWGNQIRSYVLHPYKQVKDSRSGYETSDAQAVLDGDLNELIESLIS